MKVSMSKKPALFTEKSNFHLNIKKKIQNYFIIDDIYSSAY